MTNGPAFVLQVQRGADADAAHADGFAASELVRRMIVRTEVEGGAERPELDVAEILEPDAAVELGTFLERLNLFRVLDGRVF